MRWVAATCLLALHASAAPALDQIKVERRGEVVAATKAAGYAYVTLDLEGFRSGNLNDTHRSLST